ncbi:hypothetical protein PYW08_016226 [Mythimna loreyi]|uniref:Uncharacterized protein n=1 Tax=Mythimna loreyi TaxID=667449 RepID=A0ACC2QWN3_9NEOP|nr:hypothetical protein PYW08_016226 [Mythimna loreyi]
MYFSSRTYHTNMLKAYYFICLSILLILTDHARCEYDFILNVEAGGWLDVHTEPETWEEAFVKCHQRGAVLASPLNKELAHALQLQMLQFGVSGNIFLGTHDLHSKGHYVSVEGVPLSDMDIKWSSEARVNQADSGDCLTMSVDGSVHYSSCTDPLPFICYRKPENQMLNECGTYDNKYHFNQQTGSCYKIHHDRYTWTRAYSICASEGAYLVILNDAEEARIVKDLFPPPPSTPLDGFFIGLRAWGKERIWTTIQGDRIEDVYNIWNIGEPNNYSGVENIAQCLWNGRLDDLPRDSIKRVFACESINDVFNHWNTSQPDNWYGSQDRASYLRNGYMDDVQPWTVAMFVCEKSPK